MLKMSWLETHVWYYHQNVLQFQMETHFLCKMVLIKTSVSWKIIFFIVL